MIIIEKGLFNELNDVATLSESVRINKAFVAAVSFSKYEKLHVCQYIKENG